MNNPIHLHVARALADDRARSRPPAAEGQAAARPPNARRAMRAGAVAAARLAARLDREAARQAIA